MTVPARMIPPFRIIPYAVRTIAAATGLLLLAGCGGAGEAGSAGTQPDSRAAATSGEERILTVLAAASLQEPFEEIGRAFEKSHAGVTVRFSFGGSSGLVAQLSDGAPADVLATADETTMARAVADGLVRGEPRPFASNTLQIAVPRDNPAKVSSLTDLTRSAVKVVLCAPVVPCGAAGVRVEKEAGIDIRPVSEEQSVTDVLGKVRSGEADAGLVYVTDVLRAGGDVSGIDLPPTEAAVTSYPIATLESTSDAPLTDEFVAMVSGDAGRNVLAESGFGPGAP